MMRFSRFLIRVGCLTSLLGFGIWVVAYAGFLINQWGRWGLYAGLGGGCLYVVGTSIFTRRSSGVRIHPDEKLWTDNRNRNMNDLPRQKLCELIARHGTALCDEPNRCEGLLRDLCAKHRGEVNVLVTALKERVATELLNTSITSPIELLISRLIKRLQDHQGMHEETARWAVESWALALGKITSIDLNSSQIPTIVPVESSLQRQPFVPPVTKKTSSPVPQQANADSAEGKNKSEPKPPALPPTSPDNVAVPKTPPQDELPLLKVLGWGCLGFALFDGCLNTVLASNGLSVAAALPAGNTADIINGTLWTILIIHLVLDSGLLICGRALLSRRPWGRIFGYILAVPLIGSAVLSGVIVNVGQNLAEMAATQQGQTFGFSAIAGIGIILPLVGCLLAIFLSLRPIREWSSKGRPAPVPIYMPALISLILAFVPAMMISQAASIVIGVIALVKIRRSRGELRGTWMAVLGLTISSLLWALIITVLIFMLHDNALN